jgi:hypothetical protein
MSYQSHPATMKKSQASMKTLRSSAKLSRKLIAARDMRMSSSDEMSMSNFGDCQSLAECHECLALRQEKLLSLQPSKTFSVPKSMLQPTVLPLSTFYNSPPDPTKTGNDQTQDPSSPAEKIQSEKKLIDEPAKTRDDLKTSQQITCQPLKARPVDDSKTSRNLKPPRKPSYCASDDYVIALDCSEPPKRTLLRLKSKRKEKDLDCSLTSKQEETACDELVAAKRKALEQQRRNRGRRDHSKADDSNSDDDRDKNDKNDVNAKNERSSLVQFDENCRKIGSPVEPSKKYFKMKYEIEMQNYLIDKLNRDHQAKTIRCRPKHELCILKRRLSFEVNKLRDMIQFAMCMQKTNKADQWGPIPISTVGKQKNCSEPRLCKKSFKLKPPETPSGISVVSGFEELENIKLNSDMLACAEDLKHRRKMDKINEFCKKVDDVSCQITRCEKNQRHAEPVDSHVKCEELFGNKQNPSKSEPCDDEVSAHLKALNCAMSHLLSDVETVKCNIKRIHEEFNDLKEVE